MRLDPTAGVVGVEGWDAALDDAGEEAGPEVADAVLGLRNALGDEVWRRDLRAAGLQEIPDGLLRPAGRLRRNVEIALPGLGTTTIEVVGPVSQEHDGSPAVELRGQPARDAAWSPLPGAAPPAELGGVASDRVEATVAPGRYRLAPHSSTRRAWATALPDLVVSSGETVSLDLVLE